MAGWAAGVFTVLFNRGQGMGDYWQGTYQYMDWLQLFDVVLFYIIFLIATLLLLGGFELAATYTSFREELVDKRNLPSLLSSGLNKVGAGQSSGVLRGRMCNSAQQGEALEWAAFSFGKPPDGMHAHNGAAAQVTPGRMAAFCCLLPSTSRKQAELPSAYWQQADDPHCTHSLPADVCRPLSC